MIYEKSLLELRPQIIFMSTKFDKNLNLLNAKSELRIFLDIIELFKIQDVIVI